MRNTWCVASYRHLLHVFSVLCEADIYTAYETKKDTELKGFFISCDPWLSMKTVYDDTKKDPIQILISEPALY